MNSPTSTANTRRYIDIVCTILSQQVHGERVSAAALSDVLPMLLDAKISFRQEPSCLVLTGEYVIVGDLHGDLTTLLRIFARCGFPPSRSYLFLGNYVDFGPYSCGVVFLLVSLKLLYPANVRMLGGIHEFPARTEDSDFRRQCIDLFSADVYEAVLECFAELPLCAVLDLLFCIHGGIPSRPLDFRAITRLKLTSDQCPPAVFALLCDNPITLSDFLEQTMLSRVVRSNQLCRDGYDYLLQGVVTVFSACDFLGTGNNAAVLLVGTACMSAETFAPMRPEEAAARRVIFPVWIMRRFPPPRVLQETDDVFGEEDTASGFPVGFNGASLDHNGNVLCPMGLPHPGTSNGPPNTLADGSRDR
jgi:protein phosphatase